MKIYKGDTTIECSAEEFLKIKDGLLFIEEIYDFSLVDDFNEFHRLVNKFYPNFCVNNKGENKK